MKYLRFYFLPPPPSSASTFLRLNQTFSSLSFRLRIFYGIIFFQFLGFFGRRSKWLQLENLDHPQWPVFWVNDLGIQASVWIILGIFLFGSLFALCSPFSRTARGLAFLGYLLSAAFLYSTRSIGHSHHALIWCAFVFLFLPSWKVSPSRYKKYRALTIFWAAQALILLFYSLAGFWKIYWAFWAMAAGKPHSFSLDALARHLQAKLVDTNFSTPLGDFIMQYPSIGFPLYLGTILLELLSLWFAFQRRYLRLWGVLLLGFHLGVYLMMGIGFLGASYICIYLFMLSPWVTKIQLKI